LPAAAARLRHCRHHCPVTLNSRVPLQLVCTATTAAAAAATTSATTAPVCYICTAAAAQVC
jgi:hypothetical protein